MAYVARFATSRGKLLRYLQRKLRERGWDGPEPFDEAADRIAGRLIDLGYVDDGAFATARARSFESRGLGPRRLAADLTAAGVGPEQRAEAGSALDPKAAAIRFAKRRRFGPFATDEVDTPTRERQLGAMLRAGHSFDFARRILDCRPGEEPDFS